MRRLALVSLALSLAACSTQPGASAVSIGPPQPAVAFPAGWPYQSNVAAAVGSHGMVASDAPLASRAGVEIMQAGGNAVDAAVAVGFALAVVYPEAGNLGGGGFTLVRMADGRVAGFDYREVAPLAASRNMFVDDSGHVTNASRVGPFASGVPGSVAGLVATHRQFGSLPLARVLAPAIRYAMGFAVDSLLASSLRRHTGQIGVSERTTLFFPGGEAIAEGAVLRQPALARTLRAVADSGADAFYTGSLARRLADDLRASGSIITADDLARYKVELRDPLRAMYRGHTIVTMPPPSSGVTLIEALNILEGFGPLPAFGSPRAAHLVGASLQFAFLDRNALLGDPAFSIVPVGRLSDKSYAAKVRAGIGARATPTPGAARAADEGTHTTHYTVVDALGNVVSTTTTINDLYGSGVYLPNVGFFMNDEMDDFAARPGQPNAFGLVQGERNAIEPGKRMLSSMLPTIVLDRAGQPLLALGARGGPRIISSVMQVIVNVLDHHMMLVDAINAPRLHHQALPDTLRYERDGFTPALLDSLRALGYGTDGGPGLTPYGNVASVNAVMRVANGWLGYSDPRSGGRPAGY